MTATLVERFSDRSRIMSGLLGQALVANDRVLAEKLAQHGKVQSVAQGEVLIEQNAWDTDLFFILAGEFQVIINGCPMATRGPGLHVGELAGADPSKARTATIIATSESIVFRLTQESIEDAAGENPAFWRRAFLTASARLDERNSRIGRANDIPRVFVISSSEGLEEVRQIVRNLDGKEIAVETWNKGTFGVSDYPISSLMDAMEACDFTIAVIRADDTLVMRGQTRKVARDNIHLEYGLSLGTLGRRRSILLICADDGVSLPSDLAGLTTYRYSNRSLDELKRSIRDACIEARDHILSEGVFNGRAAG